MIKKGGGGEFIIQNFEKSLKKKINKNKHNPYNYAAQR